MNWLDIVLLAVLIIAAVMGMKIGLLGAAVNAIAVIIGWMLAGQFSDDVGGIFKGSLSNDRLVTVISYVIIMVVSLVVAQYAWKIIRPLVSLATLGTVGMIDRIGGLVLGLIMGLVFTGAIIIVLARFTYEFNLPDEGIAGLVAGQIPQVEETKESVEGTLMDSAVVPTFINITDALPGSALGFVPSDFKASLDILKSRIEV